MTHAERTAITLIVDRSGSMQSIVTEAQGALDEFMRAQAEVPGDVLWTVVLFNKGYERPWFLNNETPQGIKLCPEGMTALNDAVGRTVEDMGIAFSAMNEYERPAKVIVAILTDGHENSSTDYTTAQVRQLIERQTNDWQWEFVFLATGLTQWDAERMAVDLGVARGQTISVGREDHYVGTQYVADYVVESRMAGPEGMHSTLGEVKAKREKEQKKSS